MGSRIFDGIRFHAHSDDHDPAHVHAKIGRAEVVLMLLPDDVGATRTHHVTRSELRKILKTGRANRPALGELWTEAH